MSAIDIQLKLLEHGEQLLEYVTFCTAVEKDPALRERLRKHAGSKDGQETLVRPGHSQVCISFSVDETGPLEVFRKPKLDSRCLDLAELINRDAEFKFALSSTLNRSSYRDHAVELIEPIFNPKASLNGRQIAYFLKLAPLIEQPAYKYFARASILLDELRPVLLEKSEAQVEEQNHFLEYWTVLHTMGHMLTIASTKGARSWLAEMASSFRWITWTPSFTLVRERTLWLMMAAIRSTMAFGESVADIYLSKLSAAADSPIKRFDALIGLATLGLNQPGLAENLIVEIMHVRNSMAAGGAAADAASMFDDAIRILRNPEESAPHLTKSRHDGYLWQLGPNARLKVDALSCDPTERLGSGEYIGFALLPFIARMEPTTYYPSGNADLLLPSREVRRMVRRAWSARKRSARTLH